MEGSWKVRWTGVGDPPVKSPIALSLRQMLPEWMARISLHLPLRTVHSLLQSIPPILSECASPPPGQEPANYGPLTKLSPLPVSVESKSSIFYICKRFRFKWLFNNILDFVSWLTKHNVYYLVL